MEHLLEGASKGLKLASGKDFKIDVNNLLAFNKMLKFMKANVSSIFGFTKDADNFKISFSKEIHKDSPYYENFEKIKNETLIGECDKGETLVWIKLKLSSSSSEMKAYFISAFCNKILTLLEENGIIKNLKKIETYEFDVDLDESDNTESIRATTSTVHCQIQDSRGDLSKESEIYSGGIPSTKEEYDDFIKRITKAMENNKLSRSSFQLIKSSITFENTSFYNDEISDFLKALGSSKPNTSNVRYINIDNKLKNALKEAFNAIIISSADKVNINKVIDGDPTDLSPAFLEGLFVLNTPKVSLINNVVDYSYDAEFYSLQHFPVIDYSVKTKDNIIFPISVKDGDGGNKSTCCTMINKESLKKVIKLKDNDSLKDYLNGIPCSKEIIELLDDECKKFIEQLNLCKYNEKSLTEIDSDEILNPNGMTPGVIGFGLRDIDGTTSPKIFPEEDSLLSQYISRKFLQASMSTVKRNQIAGEVFREVFDEIGPLNRPEEGFGHNIKKVLIDENGPIQNMCEAFAIPFINSYKEGLKYIKYCIVDLPSSCFNGIPVFKVKPAGAGKLECIPQDYDVDEIEDLPREERLKREAYISVLGKTETEVKLKKVSKRAGGKKVVICAKRGYGPYVREAKASSGNGQFFGYEFDKKKISMDEQVKNAKKLANLLYIKC